MSMLTQHRVLSNLRNTINILFCCLGSNEVDGWRTLPRTWIAAVRFGKDALSQGRGTNSFEPGYRLPLTHSDGRNPWKTDRVGFGLRFFSRVY